VAVVAGVVGLLSGVSVALLVLLGLAGLFAATALSMRVLRRLMWRQRENRAITVVEEDGRWIIVR
jgi:hypothetical protein